MIYIVRHGETSWNKKGRIAGRSDISLNDVGVMQAYKLKKELDGIKFDVVFSSPLKRAYETAQIISSNNIIKDNRLIERSNGKLEGKLKNEIDDDIDFNDVNESRYDIESITDFRERIDSFFLDIDKNYKNKNVLIVTHAGVGIYARCYFEGEPKDGDYLKYKIKNGEVVKYNNNHINIEDLECITDVDIDSYLEFYHYVRSKISDKSFLGVFTKDEIVDIINDGGKIFLYYLNQEIICSMFYMSVSDKTLSKHNINLSSSDVASCGPIMVNPDYVGNSLQYQMLEKLDEYCIINGKKYIFTKVSPDNTYSINNFIRGGYKYIETYESNHGGKKNIYLKKLDRKY